MSDCAQHQLAAAEFVATLPSKGRTVDLAPGALEEALTGLLCTQHELGREEALREVDIWLGPVLAQLEKESAPQEEGAKS